MVTCSPYARTVANPVSVSAYDAYKADLISESRRFVSTLLRR